jgi:serine/threonine-protein kinase
MTEASLEKSPRLTATGIAVGDVIGGKYRVDGELGAGGMGVVLSATHLELDAPVAIKLVRDEYARNEEVVSRMLFEARAAAKLRSSHVVRVLDVARVESGAPYIVMERLEGSDLAGVLSRNGALPVEDAVDYLLQACEGLVEAHALGIIHRDLKPENLFLAQTPEGDLLKVLDFGISKDTGTSMSSGPRSVMTNAGYAVGSPYYMSPEQMRATLVDSRADIWSLGAILFELLSGRCPFEGESLQLVCAKVLGDEAPRLRSLAPDVPEGLEAIVARCLQKDRELRFANVGALAVALRAFASIDGQRSVDRSTRPGSGIKLRADASLPPAPLSSTLDSAAATPLRMPRSATPGPSELSLSLGASTDLRNLRPSSRWRLAVGAAALLLLLGGVWALARSGTGTPSQAAPVAASAPAVEKPHAEAESAHAAEPALAPVVSAESLPVSTSSRHSASRLATGAKAAVAATPAPSAAPAVKSAQPAPAPAPGPKASANPWDPDRLGGRY